MNPALSWRLGGGPGEIDLRTRWPATVTADWAFGGSTGEGASVCVVDSGVEPDHPRVGVLRQSYAVVGGADGGEVVPADAEDVCGHGTACASVIRSIAPDCDIYSLRVLGSGAFGSGDVLIEGLRWAVRQGFDVVNLSLSTTQRKYAETLREIADEAYFRGTLIVASAHNLPVESFPWRFSSVISVGSHAIDDPGLFLYNPTPPVEFFAPGNDVEVGWSGGQVTRCTGNSFATPHIAGRCALILGKHPGLTPFQVKNALFLAAANVRGAT